MTRYDFTTQPNRLNQNTMKWHEAESNPELLELWVADMDFLPVPEIRMQSSTMLRHIFWLSLSK